MAHLKQHVFDPESDTCIFCGADLQEGDLPCDHALESAPDYFDEDDKRWQDEESQDAKMVARDEKYRTAVEEAPNLLR